MDFFITKGHFLIKEFSSLEEMIEFHKQMPVKLRAEVRLNDLSGNVGRYADGLDIAYDYSDALLWHSVAGTERR